jgi:hypothetical protein
LELKEATLRLFGFIDTAHEFSVVGGEQTMACVLVELELHTRVSEQPGVIDSEQRRGDALALGRARQLAATHRGKQLAHHYESKHRGFEAARWIGARANNGHELQYDAG